MVETQEEFSQFFTMKDIAIALKFDKILATKEVEEQPMKTQEDYIAKYNELKCFQNFLTSGYDMAEFDYL